MTQSLTLLGLVFVVVKAAGTPEELEELDLLFPWDADPLVRDLEDDHVRVEGVGLNADGDGLELWRVFHRVDQQVQHHLLQPLFIRTHALWHARTLLQVDDDVFAVGVEVDEVEDFLEEAVDIEGLLLKRELIGLDAQVVL